MKTISSRAGRAATLITALALTACMSVDGMYARYQKGDESQYARLVEIAARPDYPYATRKTAVRALGEIGSPQALPVLVQILREFDRRTTLKEEALVALGRIGDPAAVTPIGRLLDRSLTEPNAELRMAAMPVLSQLGGEKAAEILVNALMYYDILMTRTQKSVQRGVFSGDEQGVAALRDSVRQPGVRPGSLPGLGDFSGQGTGGIGFFGSSRSDFVAEKLPDSTPKERVLAHESLLGVGAPAVGVIQTFLDNRDMTTTLRQELALILGQIQGIDAAGETEGGPGVDAGEPRTDAGDAG